MEARQKQRFLRNSPVGLASLFFILLVLFLIGAYLGLRFGAVSYSHHQLMNVLGQPLVNSAVQDVVIDIRLPRLLAACLVGSAMAQAGAIMQGVTRNAIADPGLLGINAGAGLALIVSYAIFGSLHYSQILLVCLLGSLLASLLVFSLSYQPQKGYHPLRLILAGAMVSTLFSALGQGVTTYFELSTAIIGWQAGGLVQVNWAMLVVIAPLILIGLGLAQVLSHQLTILSLDDTVAKNLGQHTQGMTVLLLALVLLLSAAAVALVGSLSFVGLIIPHFIRHFTGRNYRVLLPLSAFAGACFLLWVDLIGRVIQPPAEIPISAIISLIGLPWFLWLMKRGEQL